MNLSLAYYLTRFLINNADEVIWHNNCCGYELSLLGQSDCVQTFLLAHASTI